MRILKRLFAILSLALLVSNCAKVSVPDTELVAVTKTIDGKDLRGVRYRLLSDVSPEKEDVPTEELKAMLVGMSCTSNENVTLMMGVIDKLCSEPELKGLCDYKTKAIMNAAFARAHKAIAKVPKNDKEKRRGRS